MEVKGRGVVTVVDGSEVVTTSYTATGTQPLMMSGVKLHTLPRGAVFDLVARRLVSAPGLPDTGRADGGDAGGRAGGIPATEPADRRRGRARDHLGAAAAPGVVLTGPAGARPRGEVVLKDAVCRARRTNFVFFARHSGLWAFSYVTYGANDEAADPGV